MPNAGAPLCMSAISVPQSGTPGDEGLGAVDRVEHPDVFGVRALVAEFLADDAMLGNVGLINRRIAASAARSASVTGSKSWLRLVVDAE